MQEWAQDKIPGSLSGRKKGEEIVAIYSFQAEYGGEFYVSFPIQGSGAFMYYRAYLSVQAVHRSCYTCMLLELGWEKAVRPKNI